MSADRTEEPDTAGLVTLGGPRRRRARFMLTPLVDVMFLLLIFFMLTSQTAPYSLISILAGQAGGAQASAPASVQAAPSGSEVIVSISGGFVRFNGEDVPMADIREAIARYRSQGFDRAAALTTQSATVQDVVTVLEAFETSDFGELRLMMPRGAP